MTIDISVRRTSLLLLGGCALTLALTLAGIGRAASDVSGATGYVVGEAVDVPVDWYGGSETLLVFLRSDCAASQALAGALTDLRRKIPTRIRMLAVVSSTLSERETMFAEGAGFERDAVRRVAFESLRLRVVPALVLVDEDGRVKMERLGTASGLGGSELVSELSTLASGL